MAAGDLKAGKKVCETPHLIHYERNEIYPDVQPLLIYA
jgi:hypothetical protein